MAKKAAKRPSEKKKTHYRKPKPYKRKRASRNDGCFLTTACVEYKGLSDNCVELKILRKFRDTYVKSLPLGSDLINEYYSRGPALVKRLKLGKDHEKDFAILFNEISHAVNLIRKGELETALQFYITISKQLEKKYL